MPTRIREVDGSVGGHSEPHRAGQGPSTVRWGRLDQGLHHTIRTYLAHLRTVATPYLEDVEVALRVDVDRLQCEEPSLRYVTVPMTEPTRSCERCDVTRW